MHIEVIAIGNEILSGFTVNTNAAFISQALLKAGLQVSRHTALLDDARSIRSGLSEAIQRSTLVITTGGLGPTCDDVTRQVVADLFDSDFHLDQDILQDLLSRYGQNPTLEDQATVPDQAIPIKNTLGTAPGFIFENSCTLILLPGVPSEMKQMMLNDVIPYLSKKYFSKEKLYSKRLNLSGLPEAAVDPTLRQLSKEYKNISYGIYPSQGTLSVHLTTYSNSENEAEALLNAPYKILAQQFSAHTFTAESGKLEEAVHHWFIKHRKTLSVAESCTGGRVATQLTELPGSSSYFLSSVVAYSNQSKIDFLGVPKQLIEEHGAVSQEVVAAMLQGILDKTQSDFGLAVTGIAGPDGGTPEKPVGTIWCAVGKQQGEPYIWKLQARGNREMILTRCVNALLAELLQFVHS